MQKTIPAAPLPRAGKFGSTRCYQIVFYRILKT
jgi:hypothetical protein